MMSTYLVLTLFLFSFITFGNTEICNPCKAKQEIFTDKAPSSSVHAQAILAGNFLFVSGFLGETPDGKIIDETAGGQTRQALTNIGNILQEANFDFSHVVKTVVVLSDINDYDEVNEAYKDFFPDPTPARSVVGPPIGGLPLDAKVAIDVTAVAN
jgi:2-iminobutanoate/2-iminopropanoate deaminase